MATKQKMNNKITKTKDLAKNLGGRPVEYRPEFVGVVEEYLKTVGRGQTVLAKKCDIALLLGCNENTVTEWGKTYPKFSRALLRVELIQKKSLMDDSFYGGREINSNVGIFLLSSNHGMNPIQKQEVDLTLMPYENMSDEKLNVLIDQKYCEVKGKGSIDNKSFEEIIMDNK